VDVSAGPKPIAQVTSPQVMFVRQANASVVASPATLEGPVIFEFRLAHK
jgi:hypothetical protein